MDKRLNILIATSQLNSREGKQLGTGTLKGIVQLARLMKECGIQGDIYDLPNGSQRPDIASPFSLNNGFALKTDELDCFDITELVQNRRLYDHVSQIAETFLTYFKSKRVVDYALKRSIIPWITSECFHYFQNHATDDRRAEFSKFKATAAYWLEEYTLFELYKELRVDLSDPAYRDTLSRTVDDLKERHWDRFETLQYVQFLCYEQRQALKKELLSQSIGLVVNLPFGVELESADVFFHPDVFDSTIQVGCSPEPEHGYPEQAWGIAAYKEKTPGLKHYLIEKTRWLSRLGDGVFIDHMVGWCGQYVLPMRIPDGSEYPHGWFLTENREERKETIRWVLDIFLESGLSIKGEIAGDLDRVNVTRQVVDNLLDKGNDITAMVIPRWEEEDGQKKPLALYAPNTLTMVETHDTSTQLQYLLNKKGYSDDFESEEAILAYCNRVLALPFFTKDVPLKLSQIDETVWLEICRRLVEGSPSNDIVFTISGLLSMLSAEYRSPSIENNINIKPGTSGLVGNGWGNWSYFSPPIELMTEDPFVKASLTRLGKRQFKPFDGFHHLLTENGTSNNLAIIYSTVSNREIIYRDASRKWSIWHASPSSNIDSIKLELAIYNYSEAETWQRIDLSSIIDLERSSFYSFQDLNGDQACYTYSAKDLKDNLFFVKLMPDQIHHFLLYQTK